MKLQLVIYLLLIQLFNLCAAKTQNYDVHRQVDLKEFVVRETVQVTFGSSDEALTEYHFGVPEELFTNNNVAAVFASDREEGHDLIVEAGDVKDSLKIYRVFLHNIVPAGERGSVSISIVVANVLEAVPKQISQFGTNSVQYQGRLWFSSPYETAKSKTTFKAPGKEGLTYTKTDKYSVRASDSTVVYSSQESVAANSKEQVTLNFVLNKPNLRVTKYVKEISISQWNSRVRISEDIDLTNDVASLEGHYSRVDQMKMMRYMPKTYQIFELEYNWPAEAFNPYYIDEVGNISTSHFFSNIRGSKMEIKPRFPLFGGWRYHWYQGYDLPLSSVAKTIRKTGETVIELPLWSAPKGMHADDSIIKIVLPEGAKNPKLYSPVQLSSVKKQIEFSYLDGPKGRTCLVASRKNLVDEHNINIQISYEYPTVEYLRKPLTLAAFLAAVFVTILVVGSMDFSISPLAGKGQAIHLKTSKSK